MQYTTVDIPGSGNCNCVWHPKQGANTDSGMFFALLITFVGVICAGRTGELTEREEFDNGKVVTPLLLLFSDVGVIKPSDPYD